MYRIGIMGECGEFGVDLETWIAEYGTKMRLRLEICIWRSEEELMDAIDQHIIPDILYLGIGSKIKKEKAQTKIYVRKVDGRTREAQLNPKPNTEELDEIQWTGVRLGRRLRERADCDCMQLIYVSDGKAFYDGLIQTCPMDYLIKPLSREKVNASLRKAIRIVKDKNERFCFQRGRDSYFLPMREIMYVCGEYGRVLITTPQRAYDFYGRLKDVVPELPEEFLFIHRSYIINKNYIRRYDYEYLEMADGTVFSISRPNRSEVRRILLDR